MRKYSKLRRGEDHPSSVLTEEDVRLLRALYREGERLRKEARDLSLDKIAEKFNISRSTAHEAVTRKTWRHVY